MRQPVRGALAARLVVLLLGAGCAAAREREVAARVPTTSDAAAWRLVPRPTPPLPSWALATIESLPITTALQVDLDAIHRTENPLGVELAARIRWIVADANRCEHARQSAEADLARAGLGEGDLLQLGDIESRPEPERAALSFARDLTLAAAAIPDDEVAELVAAYGADDVVAIVHTVAHANFQNRLFLALGLEREPEGATPPVRTRVSPDAEAQVPERAPPRAAAGVGSVVASSGASDARTSDAADAWSPRTRAELRELLERQKQRSARVPEPDAVRLARLPRPERERIARTTWGRVSRGYQPLLAGAWSDTMRAFGREAQLDEVLANTMFWVVTRTNDCFY